MQNKKLIVNLISVCEGLYVEENVESEFLWSKKKGLKLLSCGQAYVKNL